MSDVVLKVENLGKRYILDRQQQESYLTLRDTIADITRKLFNTDRQPTLQARGHIREDFWALKDVCFEVKQGEIIGIIGRNGAGKSTLLKILSRITEPTQGNIRIRGRVASLLEVGTGFHPELTGRENIFLNGTILGMSKAEITARFDEIVDFAEIEKFLDTPVKRYSSGMYVRLAFAVAAHLESEISIVDEVLAVGDARFQKKCLGKMERISKSGRTVLFVSHNMSTIQSLCPRCILLQTGQIIADTNTSAAIPQYLQDTAAAMSFSRHKQVDGKPTIISGKISYGDDLAMPERLQIDLEIFSEIAQSVALDIHLIDAMGCGLGFGDLGTTDPSQAIDLNSGFTTVALTLPIDRLAVGGYYLSLALTLPWIEYLDRAENCLFFEVVRSPPELGGCVLSQEWGFGSIEFPLQRIDR
jgi:lipopolysaccharide transport system ATP-binding protein